MLKLIEALYKHTTLTVWNGQYMSNYFEVSQGVRQGCLLSPTLFSLFLNDLEDELPHGVYFGGHTFKLLMYADDLVVMADSLTELQKNIDAIEKFCDL